jgi:hypothetical protein
MKLLSRFESPSVPAMSAEEVSLRTFIRGHLSQTVFREKGWLSTRCFTSVRAITKCFGEPWKDRVDMFHRPRK